MAQTGYTPISLYYSTTASQAPTAGNLANGELAINITDGKLYYKDNLGAVKVIAGSGGTGIVAGSNTQIQFNNNGVFGASANLTWDGSFLTVASIKDSALTSGRVTYAGASGLLQDSANLTFNGTTLTTNTLNLTNALTTAYGGTGLTSFTAGDLPYYASGTALSKLGIGTNGQILTSSGTAPQWTTLSGVAVTTFSAGTTGFTPSSATAGAVTLAGTLITSNGGTGLSSYTAGDLTYYASGTALTKLGIGAANTVLTSSGSAPQWSTSLTLAGNLVVNGNTTLGDATSDTITANARLASDLVPSTNNARDLGSSSLAYRSIYAATSFVENGYAVVTQADIGTADNEIPLNQYLGTMAYQDGTNYFNTGMTVGYRNRFFNGDMRIAQRSTGPVTNSAGGVVYDTIDRWGYWAGNAGAFSIAQSTVVPTGAGFSYSALITSLGSISQGSNTYAQFCQRIEGFNIADLNWGTSNARPVTISFWIRSSLTGTFSAYLFNSGYQYCCPFTFNIPSANTWVQITQTVSGPTAGTWNTTNGIGVEFGITLLNGNAYLGTNGVWVAANFAAGVAGSVNLLSTNGATMYITGVQFEVGTQATPFDWRPYTTEYQLCQRYFEKSLADGTAATAIANTAPTLVASAYNTSFARTQVFYKVPKRATPTLTTIPSNTVGSGNQWGWYNGSWNASATTIAQQNANAFSVDISGTYTQFYSYIIDGNWYASAEL